VKHLVFASSSSVYGANTKMPYSVHDNVDHPISLYAATKKSNELMAHTYSHLFGLPCTGLRFFTVYGPWGRPDMAIFKFTRALIAGEPIDIYNHGEMKRDFTYIDDIVEGIVRVIRRIPVANPNWNGLKPDPASSFAPYRIFNIGNRQPVELMRMVQVLEESLNVNAKLHFLPLQPGDVLATFADVADLETEIGFRPKTSLEVGLKRFVDWYLNFYREKESMTAARSQ
jgi:UDP-glucuronate 4-epimerase